MASIGGTSFSFHATADHRTGVIKRRGLKNSPSDGKLGFLTLPWCPSPFRALQSGSNRSVEIKAQKNYVAADVSLKAAAAHDAKAEVLASGAKNDKPASNSSPAALVSRDSINYFLAEVSNLVKLVDSRDIVELQLKQADCELLIRKLRPESQALSPTPVVMMQAPPPVAAPPAVAAAPVMSPSTPSPAAAAPTAKQANSSLPPLKCPMSGTFYRSPGPGEPPFVKVGDKVRKGQALCIVEAMKLMNEIEADQSGTIVEILAEDGKPVSVDTPLLVIQP